MNGVLEQINSIGEAFVEFARPMLVQSSVLIAILLLIDFVLRKRVRAVFRYWIWMLVLVKLVLPTSLSSPVSLGYWFGEELRDVKVIDTVTAVYPERAPQVTQERSIEVKGEVPAVAAAKPSDEPALTETVNPPAVSVTTLSWEAVLFLAWLAGVVLMGGLLIQRAIFVSGLVFQAKSAGNLMTDVFEYCCGQMGLKGKVSLKVSANATSPAVCGLFRPVILVPGDLAPSLGASRLRAVLLHELAHIKRGDLWVSLAQTVLQILYFYNPLLWAANFVIRRVREQAVDEAVQVVMGEKAREYPQTLVEVAKLAFKRPTLSLRLIGVVESKSALKGRIKRMLSRPIPRSAKLGAAGLLAVIVAGAVLLPMAGAESGPPTFIVKGRVVDAETNQPIAGAKVGDVEQYAKGKQWTTTDVNGNYSYKTWYEEHGVKAEANGYKRQDKGFGTKLFGSEKEKVIDFALEKRQSEGLEPPIIPAEFVGHWKGRAKIIVNWTRQRWLSIDIEVMPDGKVTGRVGDSELKDAVLKSNRGWLGKKLNIKTDWMIRSDLIGPIIKNENIKREYINLLFDDLDTDGKIKGGFHTSGKHIGNKKTMVMSGTAMVLEKTSPDTASFSATLANGVTVELVGVCEHPSIGKQWWRPDGTLKDERPYKARDEYIISDYNDNSYQLVEFAVKISHPGYEDVSTQIVVPTATRTSVTDADENEEDVSMQSIACAVPKLFSELEVFKVGAAYGRWQELSSIDAELSQGFTDDTVLGKVIWDIPKQSKGGAAASLAHTLSGQNTTVFAEDTNGNLIKAPNSRSSGSTGKYEFYIPLSGIMKFHFMTRSYEWVEFKDVSLKPNFKTDVEIEVDKAAGQVEDNISEKTNKNQVKTITLSVLNEEAGTVSLFDFSDQKTTDIKLNLDKFTLKERGDRFFQAVFVSGRDIMLEEDNDIWLMNSGRLALLSLEQLSDAFQISLDKLIAHIRAVDLFEPEQMFHIPSFRNETLEIGQMAVLMTGDGIVAVIEGGQFDAESQKREIKYIILGQVDINDLPEPQFLIETGRLTAESMVDRAAYALAKDDVVTAQFLAQHSAELKPVLTDALLIRGMVYVKTGEYDKAREFYERALELYRKENNFDRQSLVLKLLGRDSEAEALYSKIDPNFEEPIGAVFNDALKPMDFVLAADKAASEVEAAEVKKEK